MITKKRLLYREIVKQINHKNALIVTGMRQVGKTTLMRQVFDTLKNKKKLWFDFDNPLEQKTFEDNEYRNIYTRLIEMANASQKDRLFIFIDEIQNYPEITKVIKYLIDHYSVKFLLTGSSNYYLKNLFPESLSGRKFLYYLHPLSFKEFLYFSGETQEEKEYPYSTNFNSIIKKQNIVTYKSRQLLFDNYMRFGGFPEVVVTKDIHTKKQILSNILTSFFEKDLKVLSNYKDIRELRDLILLLAPRVGSMLDISKLSSELGVDRPKIYSFLEFLQATFFIRLLPKYSQSIDRAVAGGKKVYFTDTGLLNALTQLNQAQVLENAVVNQFAHYGDLSFYNKRNTAEIDVVINKKIGIEIKRTATQKDSNRLGKISLSLDFDEYYVASENWVEDKKLSSKVMYPQFL